MSDMPAGYTPPASSGDFQPVRLAQMTSLEFLTPERVAVVQELSHKLARDPELLASIERMLRENGVDLDRMMPEPAHLASFGWTDSDLARLPSPKQAAAAVGAAVAAVAGGPGAAAVVAV